MFNKPTQFDITRMKTRYLGVRDQVIESTRSLKDQNLRDPLMDLFGKMFDTLFGALERGRITMAQAEKAMPKKLDFSSLGTDMFSELSEVGGYTNDFRLRYYDLLDACRR